MAAEVFVLLRQHTSANVELTNEFATDLCFERAKENLKDQPYLLGNQWHRLWRLAALGVDVAVCDSPIGLGAAYLENKPLEPYWKEMQQPYLDLMRSMRKAYPSVDIWLDRDVYATGGFKGNSKKKVNNWINQLDKRIQKEADAEYNVLFSKQAGREVFELVVPFVRRFVDEPNR